jgi:aldehyde dehydrogenase (NAD+)
VIYVDMNLERIDRLFHLQSDAVNLQRLKDTSAAQRLAKIRKVESYISDPVNKRAFTDALFADMRKPEEESLVNELVPTLMTITYIKKHLHSWVRDERVESPVSMSGMRSYIRYEPKGNVLIFSPWNYPFQLTIMPMLYAIAAGNAVIIKPSEFAPATAAFIEKMVSSLFPENEVAVINGEVETATALLKKPFNHIFFTGSPSVGKIVMEAAAKNLTSVTLELGGKSPVIIDPSYGAARAARKLVWAKTMNCGQTCIAPDYIFIPESQHDEFVSGYREALEKFYNQDGAGIKKSRLYSRMVNLKNFHRVKSLVDDAVGKGAELLCGGETDESDLYISPVLLGKVNRGMKVMQEEIFGPVMPVVTYNDRNEVVKLISEMPKPLALYILSGNSGNTDFYMNHTTAGGTAINELMVTTVNQNLPFGGINNSGIGKSNGKYSFHEFSNARGVVKRVWGTISLLYPPYSKPIINLLQKIARF